MQTSWRGSAAWLYGRDTPYMMIVRQYGCLPKFVTPKHGEFRLGFLLNPEGNMNQWEVLVQQELRIQKDGAEAAEGRGDPEHRRVQGRLPRGDAGAESGSEAEFEEGRGG